ncbi:MAG: pseudouridine-5'-phosphate glycosidase [Acidimicrobiaceae bacterium]|nr:pseudouridine-5'-phosphate glycosidase [Acidimicrobiaceae bacterium]MXZ64551.1 pseudouridine-5'-phosphate glycosidase [Acidimicrobiaceae bacterium]MYF33820.1 pseudouridine-5'-phosphate glycosidase [Acidimicrobiaceae bacterium]MYG78435.1 pseudouridine-5'-phosphate glycosidase [Acidimicrobiaceae bacterium]MYJ29329.1 pseudouridine-5'-phosphate glycosidase [Acidimicrobiaceae bacterium]
MDGALQIGSEVADAVASGTPVVALESTIFSELGLPEPANRQCFRRVQAAVRASGAVPALCGVLDGRAVVGANFAQAERLFGGSVKVGARDLGPGVASGLEVGVTTVSATVTLAAAAGIEVFATGGIGGVHRGAGFSGDVSADLEAISRHRVVVVSSGVKAFLDVSLTFERLETLGVAVLGWRTDRFPAFYVRDGGPELSSIVSDGHHVAAALRSAAALGHPGGILVANPIPPEAELDRDVVAAAVADADAAARRDGVSGADVTPAVLTALTEVTGGAVVPANIALAESNATVAAEIAVALVRMPPEPRPGSGA